MTKRVAAICLLLIALPVLAAESKLPKWEAMDYEFGAEMATVVRHRANNPLMEVIEEAIRNAL